MSLAGAVARLTVSLITLEAIQAWRRWRSAPVPVPQSKPPIQRSRLRVVQGGRR